MQARRNGRCSCGPGQGQGCRRGFGRYSARGQNSEFSMPDLRYDVLGIGNAIVDVIARADDDFLVRQKMQKGGMALIDEGRADPIYDAMAPAVSASGGSAANTMVGVAGFGARAAFVGKIKDDELGRAFAHDARGAGVGFAPPPASDGPSTARCYVLVTADGERTMNTYLGAAQDLHPQDIDADAVAGAAITYLEGYLWDPKHAKDAFLKAAAAAHEAKRLVALTLSDAFCVDRWRDEFLGLMRAGTVDLLFANEADLRSLYQTADFDSALAALRREARLAVVTRSAKGCVVASRAQLLPVPPSRVEHVVDTTGAGDLFAAGFFFGPPPGPAPQRRASPGAPPAPEGIQPPRAPPPTPPQAPAPEARLP